MVLLALGLQVSPRLNKFQHRSYHVHIMQGLLHHVQGRAHIQWVSLWSGAKKMHVLFGVYAGW